MKKTICITTNITCNLNCVYCYEKDKSSQTTFDLAKAKHTLQTELSHRTEDGTYINFHGGEPFLSFEKIRSLCEWAWSQSFEEKYTFFATSNGTLIHGKIKEWLYENRHRFVVGLSLDGTREMHNNNRSNSFDLIDIDFFIKTWPFQGVKMTISPVTIHNLAEGLIFIHEKGFKNISANLAEMTDWSDPVYLSVYKRELKKLADYYLSNPGIDTCALFKVYFPRLTEPKISKWCGAGTDMEAIDIDGKKYPCHLFFESVCGKEKSEGAIMIDFTNPENYTSEYCRECIFLPVCPTCYGANYLTRGDIASRDLSLCNLHKIRFIEVAKFQYNQIMKDTTKMSDLSDGEKIKRLKTLEGIEKMAHLIQD